MNQIFRATGRVRRTKSPLIVDNAAAQRSIELMRQSQRELRHAAPRAFGDQDRFLSLSENIAAIIRAASGGDVDPRLVRAPAGMNEGDGAAGGFLLQTNFSQKLATLAYEQSFIAGLCDRRETARPFTGVNVPAIDETSRANGSRYGGVISTWLNESSLATPSLVKFKNIELVTKKLLALVYGTDELMADAPMWEAHVERAVAAELAFQLDLAILSGTGVGRPLGITNAPALIAVPKEAGQAPATIVKENISKMWKRLPAPSRYKSVWLANEDCDEQLEGIALQGSPFTYIPAGVNGNDLPLLKGRPVITVEQCPVLGSVGDLVLADLDHYLIMDAGINTAISVHVRFDSDQTLLRFTMRVDGRPSFTTPVQPFNGSLTRSPFIALQAR